MTDLFARLLLGHLVGDYLLQNYWMALKKNQSAFRCFVHCLIYTFTVCVATWHFEPVWILCVYLSHFPIDRWSLAEKWLKLIHGRTLRDFLIAGHLDLLRDIKDSAPEYMGSYELSEPQQNYHILRGSFHAIVYTVADNTMHLVLLYVGAQYLLR